MRWRNVAIAFGRVLRDLRTQKGLSQEELALIGDFDRTYPSMLERGLRTPTIGMIFQIAVVLDTPASLIVTRTLEEIDKMQG
jgi:transcriptional regulator with XRE-family HTH domain